MSDTALQIAELSAVLAAQTARAQAAEAELARARALASCTEATIQELKLKIAKLRRDKYRISSERRARLIDQLELQLEELEAAVIEDALAAEQAATTDTTSAVRAFTRRKPVRKPFPDHLPRERVVVEAPTNCSCCGSDRNMKMGEDITETLEVIPRQWKVIQTVREKFPGLRPFIPLSVHWTLSRRWRTGLHPAEPARRSASHQHPSMRSHVDGPGPA